MKCNIKTSSEAWNHAVEAFKKAFLSTGGKMTESLRYAISETQKAYPDLDFEIPSFTAPLIDSMKAAGAIPENYRFNGKDALSPEEKEAAARKKKIESIIMGMDKMTLEQKKDLAKRIFAKVLEKGYLTEPAIKNLYAEAAGLPALTPEMDEVIRKMAEANKQVEAIEDEKSEKMKELQRLKAGNGLTVEEDARIDKDLRDIYDRQEAAKAEAAKAALDLSDKMESFSFAEWRLMGRANMNLMGIKTLLKNLYGGAADTFLRNMGNAAGSTLSLIISKTLRTNNPLPFGQRALGTLEARNRILGKAKTALSTGQVDYNANLPAYNHMRAINKFRAALDGSPASRVKNFISGLLRVSPDAVSRVLASTDQIFNSSVYEAELASIAEAKGLKGAEKTAFIMEPDEASMNYARKLADKATFRDENVLATGKIAKALKFSPEEMYKRLIDKGLNPLHARMVTSFAYMGSVIFVPFVKTPVNLILQASRYVFPQVELAKGIIEARKQTDAVIKNRILYDAAGRAVVGLMLRNIALNMIAQGFMTAGFKDDDPDSKDSIEAVKKGANRINLSAYIRALMGDGVYGKKDDTWVDMSSLGLQGLIMGTYAHAFANKSEEEREKLSEISPINELKFFGYELQSALDNTFLSGTNQIFQALNDNTGDKFDRVSINAFMVMMAGIVPATAQTLSTQKESEVKKQYDSKKTFTENLYAAFGYRFIGDSKDLKNKYFNLASEDNYGPKKKDYLFFDNYLGRVLSANFDAFKASQPVEGTPESKLLKEMDKVDADSKGKLFPAAVDKKQSFKMRKGGKSSTYKVELTDEQHEYLMQQAGKYRLMLATPYIMSKEFDNSSFEAKTTFLRNNLYKEGLEMAKKDLLANFPEIKTQVSAGNKGDTEKEVKNLKKKFMRK